MILLRDKLDAADGSWRGSVDTIVPNLPSIIMKTDLDRTIETLLFEAAIQLDEGADRRLFLESTCASDPGRLARLTKLVRYHDKSESEYTTMLDARDRLLADIGHDGPYNHIR